MFIRIFGGAKLVGLLKDPLPANGLVKGVRPLAVGEVITRLTAKAALKREARQLEEDFGDIQVGVGVKDGVGVLIRALKLTMDLCDDETDAEREQTKEAGVPEEDREGGGILTLDGENAYNLMDRMDLCKGSGEYTPGIFAFIGHRALVAGL